MNKILISTSSFDIANSHALNELRLAGLEIVANPYKRRLTEDEAAELLDENVIGMIAGVEPLTRRVLERAHSLKVISRAGIGLDNVDLEAAHSLGILVSNTPEAPVSAVAELTVGLMLDLMRRISSADRNLRTGIWQPVMGNLLGAQTVGLVGYGRIGSAVHALLRPFGCNVVINDPVFAGTSETPSCSLERLLSVSDVVSLHVPYHESSTRHMMDDHRIAQMKRGAVLLNTARGGLIDEPALARALRDGHLAGAALDTFEAEPYRGELTTLANVVLTSHMGSYAKESRSRMEQEAAQNLVAGLHAKGFKVAAN